MNITGVKIKNIKGIESHNFKITLLPNKPNILVAPNGFGKSSFAIAFASLHESKIILDKQNCYQGDESLIPQIKISTSTGKCLTADNNSNNICQEFNVFVINNPLEPKANARNYLGRLISKPTIEIKPTILVHTIPPNIKFDYRLTKVKPLFGINGKVLPDISFILSNGDVMAEIASMDLAYIKTLKWNKKVESFVKDINSKKASTKVLKDYILHNAATILDVGPYPEIIAILLRHGILLPNEDDLKFLYTWQLWYLYQKMGKNFKKACKYAKYIQDKDRYTKEIADINPIIDRINIKPKEEKGKLIVKWPKAHEISNGQRDILFFYSKILEFEHLTSSKPQILIIDEIFDYLDDTNILLFQYKISNLIDSYKKTKRIIFPVLVTHLDPNYFHHFCFNEDKINVCYLKEYKVKNNKELLKIISERENIEVKQALDEAYFHYHPDFKTYDLTDEFTLLGLNVEWATPIKLRKKLFRLLRIYLFEEGEYDPIAVCWAVRLMIEEIIFNEISSPIHKQEFINTKKTKEKLKFANRIGVFIPETYFLLGLIYNVSLHSSSINSVQSAALKLHSLVVKEMIKQIAMCHYKLFGKQ